MFQDKPPGSRSNWRVLILTDRFHYNLKLIPQNVSFCWVLEILLGPKPD